MTIKMKLIAGFAIIVLVLGVLSWGNWHSMEQLSRQGAQTAALESAVTAGLQGNLSLLRYLRDGSKADADQGSAAFVESYNYLHNAMPFVVLDVQRVRIEQAEKLVTQLQKNFSEMVGKTDSLKARTAEMVEVQFEALEAFRQVIGKNQEALFANPMADLAFVSGALQGARIAFFEARVGARIFMMSPSKGAATSVRRAIGTSLDGLRGAEAMIDDTEMRKLLEQVSASMEKYSAAFELYVTEHAQATEVQQKTREALETLVKELHASLDFAHERFVSVQQASDRMSFILMLVGAVLSVLVATMAIIAVTRPIAQAQRFAERVASGDFNARWETSSRDEMGQLAGALNRAFGKVAEKVFWYEGIINAVPYEVQVTDLDQRWMFVNSESLRGMNKRLQDVLGKRCSERGTPLCHTADCGIARLKNGTDGKVRYNQDAKDISVDITYLHDLAGNKTGYVIINRDVTDEERLRKAAADAVRAARIQAASSLEGVVEQLSSAAEQLSAQIAQSDGNASQTAQRMGETARSMDEMNGTVLDVARNAGDASSTAREMYDKAREGADIVNEVGSGMRQLHSAASSMRDDMETLDQQADDIGHIIVTISDIADQTNLLALNAAIEAARAGDAGRGFAVGADEVRKLAEKTQQATTEVGNAISRIQKATRASRDMVEGTVTAITRNNELAVKSGDTLSQILHMAEAAADKVRAIATAAEEQSATSDEISRAIDGVTQISGELSQAMNESATAVNNLSYQASELRKIIVEMRKE